MSPTASWKDGSNATVRVVRRTGERHAIVQIERDAGPLQHLAGQYIELASAGDAPTRWSQPYSIASAPGAPVLEFFVSMTGPAAASYVEGTRLNVAPHGLGLLTADTLDKSRCLILIGTGSGVAPFVSMARTYAAQRRFAGIWLFHGAFTASELGYAEELQRLQTQESSFHFEPVLEHGGSKLTRVQQILEPGAIGGDSLVPEKHDVYLCGHPAMVNDVENKLLSMGFQGRVHTERG